MGNMQPALGIFWMTPDLEDIFHAATFSLEKAQHYGHWLISQDDHVDLWDRLLSEGELELLPKRYRADYSSLARGRVSYNTEDRRFVIYHGDWLEERHVELILDCFNLSGQDRVFELDEHYTWKREPRWTA